jgi:hypothetical protein
MVDMTAEHIRQDYLQDTNLWNRTSPNFFLKKTVRQEGVPEKNCEFQSW